MPSNTTSFAQTAFWARFFIKYGIAFIAFLILARILWSAGVTIYQRISPPPPPAPTVSYGKLPAISFPESQTDKKFNFVLELPEVDLPKAPITLPVYVIPKKSSFLGAPDAARKIANSLGFDKNEDILSDTIYRWELDRGGVTLDMNIITQAFSVNSSLYYDEEISKLNAPAQEIAATAVRSFLSSADIFPKDFIDGKTTTTLIKNDNGNLVLANSLSEANFVRVDLFRENYNDFPIVTPIPGKANVWFLVSGTSDPARSIIAGEYHYFPVDTQNSSTYPIKTTQDAWQELQEGKGKIVSPTNEENVTIRRVYLAYYDPSEYQPFFQPVFVFEGDNGFVGYVPAVGREYYSQ